MSLILNIETSATVCSAALSKDSEIISYRESRGERSHATRLTPFIEEILDSSGTTPAEIDAIAVSKGPGSYTGLRIGISTAKGFAYSINKPLIGIDTMLCMCYGLHEENPGIAQETNALFCPMIDARRMEVYMAFLDKNFNYVQKIRAEIIKEGSFNDILEKNKVIFFGDGMAKCREAINHKNAIFIDNFFPLARYLALISHQYYNEQKFADIAYFEPFYLKDFIATVPRDPLGSGR